MWSKTYTKEYRHNYYLINKSRLIKQMHENYVKNKERYILYAKDWSEKNPEKRNKYVIASLHKARLCLFKLLGYECRYCREKDTSLLQIDHINNDGIIEPIKRRKSTGMFTYYYLKNPVIALLKLQLLCANCHTLKHFRYSKERMFIIELMGAECVHCKNNNIKVLQLDHINGNGKNERRLHGFRYYNDNPNKGKEKLQVLCANCNWRKRHEMKEYN